MKLGIVTYSLQIGGAENSILIMAKLFQKNGYEVEIIESEATGPWRDYFIENSISVKSFNVSILTIPYYHVIKISNKLKEFDILFLIDSPFAQASLGYLKQNTICFPQIRANLPSMYFNAASNSEQWNYITANSPLLKKVFTQRYPDLSDRVKVITNGIFVPQFRNINLSNIDDFKVIYIGQLENIIKGVTLIPQIIHTLKLKGYNISMTFVGDGPLRNDLMKQIQEYDLESKTSFLGFIPHSSVYEILRGHDFLIMPSNNEGMPNVMLEAMANQVIPIVSYLKGVTDICVVDCYNGFFGQPGNVESFVDAFERAFNMKDKLNIVAKNAYDTIKNKFSIENVEKKYMDLIISTKGNLIKRNKKIDFSILPEYPNLPIILGRFIRKIKGLLYIIN